MRVVLTLLACGLALNAQEPRYTSAGELIRPTDYREWIFLTSGVGMTYGPAAAGVMPSHPAFDNVFVTPRAHRAFLATGQWPDKTMFALEIRSSTSHGSINKGGHFQTDIRAVEVAVKDESRFPDKWVYFGFNGPDGLRRESVAPLPKSAGCYACHSANGAVDNTFVQFYPTMLEVAQKKGTLKASYHPPVMSPPRFYQLVSEQGWGPAEKVLGEARSQDPQAEILEEAALNRVGYQLMTAGKKAEAVSLLEWTMRAHPKSPNALDSLAEAYVAAGRKADARKTSERVLQMLQADTSVPAQQRDALMAASKKRIESLQQ